MRLLDEFFETARERERIRRKRGSGKPAPWSEDPIFQEYRFCNVRREHDKTTAWFRGNIRDRIGADPIKMTLATIAFRFFNRIATGEVIRDVLIEHPEDTGQIYARLEGVRPIVTGAYVIKTPPNMTKLEGICWCIDEASDMLAKDDLRPDEWYYLEEAHDALMKVPYLGSFMAYEVVTDLRHTAVLGSAPDIMTWAAPGPGCMRGLSWVLNGRGDQPFSYSSKRGREVGLHWMKVILSHSRKRWPTHLGMWEMREVEHWLCEFDKYMRAKNGKKLKRRFHSGD